MQNNKFYKSVIDVVTSRRIGPALDMLENYLLTHSHQGFMEQLQTLKTDYQLMADYWQQGYEDPGREALYDQLLRRLFVLAANMEMYNDFHSSSFLSSVHARPRQNHPGWTTDRIRQDLENFVSDAAMLSLEAEHTRQAKSEELYLNHELLMTDLFDYIWTSSTWKESVSRAFEEMLLSPTIDLNDQCLMVSAVTLALMNHFDLHKLQVLVSVYRQAFDERLRQRALVGWALSLDAAKEPLFPELRQMVNELCSDERCCKELAELQMQMVYCMDTEEDNRTIQSEIIPDLMKQSNLQIRHGRLEETDEDSLEDILHPDAAEMNMEKLEQSMNRMVNMQKQGSDIYFGGFSQMKRFPFFDHIASWFVPFYVQHPAVSAIWRDSKYKSFLRMFIGISAFCDSDKYSFLLAYNQVMDRLPPQMLKMLDRGEAMPIGGEVAEEEQKQPAFIRRLYLQNLYRFFRIYPMRSELRSPFDTHAYAYVFFANPLFRDTPLEAHFDGAASFLLKHKRNTAAARVLDNYRSEVQGYRYHMMMARLLMQSSTAAQAAGHYRQALALQPDSEKALAGVARTAFAIQEYQTAADSYSRLMLMQPDNAGYQLNAAVCLAYTDQRDEAQKLLYKLNYERPDDLRVVRVLAWVLTEEQKYEAALKLYDRLAAAESDNGRSAESRQADDLLNHGCCLWFSGNIPEAVAKLRQYREAQTDTGFNMADELLDHEWTRLEQHGITRTQALLMLDAIG